MCFGDQTGSSAGGDDLPAEWAPTVNLSSSVNSETADVQQSSETEPWKPAVPSFFEAVILALMAFMAWQQYKKL